MTDAADMKQKKLFHSITGPKKVMKICKNS